MQRWRRRAGTKRGRTKCSIAVASLDVATSPNVGASLNVAASLDANGRSRRNARAAQAQKGWVAAQ
tara:strand:- start:513 stop:710 length:198 start_codon:yes stop_codon:yes gene_type:complete